MKLLVLCPTRQRFEKCKKMVKSFHWTSFNARLHLLLDWNDPELDKYIDLGQAMNIDKQMTNTARINNAFKVFQNYDYYSVTNDDFVYETPDWDEKLMYLAEGGIAYGDDKLQGRNMPTTSVIDSRIVKALGWLQMPGLNCLYGDNVWRDIGQQLGILRYDPGVITRHEHYFSGADVDKDDTYKYTNSKEMYKQDGEAFEYWQKHNKANDCHIIRTNLYEKM